MKIALKHKQLAKLLLSDVKTFQPPQQKHAPMGLFVLTPSACCVKGRVVVDLSAQVLKDLDLFQHPSLQPEWARERVWCVR